MPELPRSYYANVESTSAYAARLRRLADRLAAEALAPWDDHKSRQHQAQAVAGAIQLALDVEKASGVRLMPRAKVVSA